MSINCLQHSLLEDNEIAFCLKFETSLVISKSLKSDRAAAEIIESYFRAETRNGTQGHWGKRKLEF